MNLSHNNERRLSARYVVALLCLLLISGMSVAQVTHDHADDAKAAQHCSVCFAAHSPSVKAVVLFVPPAQMRRAAVVIEAESEISLLLTENLYIRPPPVA